MIVLWSVFNCWYLFSCRTDLRAAHTSRRDSRDRSRETHRQTSPPTQRRCRWEGKSRESSRDSSSLRYKMQL